MAAEIESTLGLSSELKVGSSGCFEVSADGKPVFSKNETGRFPEHAEVIETLNKQLAQNQ